MLYIFKIFSQVIEFIINISIDIYTFHSLSKHKTVHTLMSESTLNVRAVTKMNKIPVTKLTV